MTSDIGAAGASRILQAAQQQQKPGTFKIKTDGAANLRRTIDQLESEAGRKQIIGSALLRLRGIQEGIIPPGAEWETVGGFLQATGQPFTIGLDERGQIAVQAQSESDLLNFTPRQQEAIREATTQMKDLVKGADFEDTKRGLRAELAFGILRIEEMKAYSPPEEFWEKQFSSYAEMGRPVKLALDGEGNKIALDQLTHDFSDVEDLGDRRKLLNAMSDLKDIISGDKGATEIWHFAALGNRVDGSDYFLDLDDAGDVVVQRNKITTVTPDFLDADANNPEVTAPWQEEALRLYGEGKSFQFGFEADGQTLKVIENNVLNLTRDDEIAAGQGRIRDALVSLLA